MPAPKSARALPALTPLLALILCAGLTSPARAQGAVETAPPLVFNSSLGLYQDPSTGYTYGPDLNHPYVPNPGGSYVISNSTLYTFTNVNTPVSVTDHTFSTTVDAMLGGTSVFDMTFNAPLSDPSVQAAVTLADAALAAHRATPGLPTQTSSVLTGLGSSTTYTQTGEAATGATTVTSTDAFGPTTISSPNLFVLVNAGAYYPPGYPSSVPFDNFNTDFYVTAGQLDTNILSTIPLDVYRTATTTTTDLLTQTYDITGTPNAAPAVPEPPALALLALGLLPVGFVAARKRIAP